MAAWAAPPQPIGSGTATTLFHDKVAALLIDRLSLRVPEPQAPSLRLMLPDDLVVLTDIPLIDHLDAIRVLSEVGCGMAGPVCGSADHLIPHRLPKLTLPIIPNCLIGLVETAF